MLHHVAMEVRPGDAAADGRFWVAAGFTEVPVPEALGDGYTWFERDGTQIHLMDSASPAIPSRGHAAVVAPEFDGTLARIRAAGFEIEEGRRLWGARRAKAVLPSGHTVELMASPPPSAAGTGLSSGNR